MCHNKKNAPISAIGSPRAVTQFPGQSLQSVCSLQHELMCICDSPLFTSSFPLAYIAPVPVHWGLLFTGFYWDVDFLLPHPVSSTFKNCHLSSFLGIAQLARFLFQCPWQLACSIRSDLDLAALSPVLVLNLLNDLSCRVIGACVFLLFLLGVKVYTWIEGLLLTV